MSERKLEAVGLSCAYFSLGVCGTERKSLEHPRRPLLQPKILPQAFELSGPFQGNTEFRATISVISGEHGVFRRTQMLLFSFGIGDLFPGLNTVLFPGLVCCSSIVC